MPASLVFALPLGASPRLEEKALLSTPVRALTKAVALCVPDLSRNGRRNDARYAEEAAE